MTWKKKLKEAWYWWLTITLVVFVFINILVNLLFPGLMRVIGPLGEDPWVLEMEYGGVNIYLPWLGILILLMMIISISLASRSSRSRKKKNEVQKGMETYDETLFSKWSTLLLFSITVIFILLYFYQIIVGPIGTDPAPNWFWLVMAVFMLAITINFGRLTTRITSAGLTVSYGIFKKRIPWRNIEDCYIDEASAIRYGGWGIRLGRVGGRWRTVYNVIGGPRVVVSLKKGRIRELVFSTENPEEVIGAIDRYLSTH